MSREAIAETLLAIAEAPSNWAARWGFISAEVEELLADEAQVRTPDLWEGDPSPRPAGNWHASQLDAIISSPIDAARIRHHARMLGHAAFPDDSRFTPLASVVIPCYNSADCVARAIDSCLAQTYSPIEILVVNDGSTDNSVEVVSRYGDKVRIVHKANGGLSSARNYGTVAALGDFVHLLDADDELRPTAVAEKVRIFLEVPDAGLCYSHYTLESDDGWPIPMEEFHQVPFNDPCAACGDFLLSTTTIYSFQGSSVMAPRWYWLATGGFTDSMRQSEDIRYWFQMAMQGCKTVAQRTVATHRYCRAGSLTQNRVEMVRFGIMADLMNAAELVERPDLYRYLAGPITRATRLLESGRIAGMTDAMVADYHRQIMALEDRVGVEAGASTGAAALLLDQCVCSLRKLQDEMVKTKTPSLAMWREREVRLIDRLSKMPKPTPEDLAEWIPAKAPISSWAALSRKDRSANRNALSQLQMTMLWGTLALDYRELAAAAAILPGHPYERFWGYAAKLSSVIGPNATRQSLRQRAVQRGWQLWGQTRARMRKRVAAES